MGEVLSLAKENLRKAQALFENKSQTFIEDDARDLSDKIKYAINTLVENEKKIWLKTKRGKEMLSLFNIAAKTLIDVIEADSDPDEIRDAVSEIEQNSKTLSEEIRKRSMVVT